MSTNPHFPSPNTRTQLALIDLRVEHVEERLSKQEEVLERLDLKLDGLLAESRKRVSERPAKDSFTINRSAILAIAFFVASVIQQLASAYIQAPQSVPVAESKHENLQ